MALPSLLAAQEAGEQRFVEQVRLSELGPDAPIVLPKNAFFDDQGWLALVDEAEMRVVLLTPSMEVLRYSGRRGDGPGEYQRPGPIGPIVRGRGGYALWDRIQGRLTELEYDLSVRRSLKYPVDFRQHGFVEALYSSGDTSFVAAATTWPMVGYSEDSFTRVFVATRSGVSVMASYPGYDLLTDLSDPLFSTVLRLPFGAATVVRFEPDGDHYWVGRTDSSSFSRIRTTDGGEVSGFELPIVGEPVTNEDRSEYLEEQESEFARSGSLARVPRAQWEERWHEIVAEITFPDRKPSWEDFVVAPGGNLWIRLHASGSNARSWLEVSPSGQVLRRVRVPHAGSVYVAAVAENLLVVSERNEFDGWDIVSYAPQSAD